MGESSKSGEANPAPSDLRFPIFKASPPRELPATAEAIRRIIELSEMYLPVVTRRPAFEARRLALKAKTPFRLVDALRRSSF